MTRNLIFILTVSLSIGCKSSTELNIHDKSTNDSIETIGNKLDSKNKSIKIKEPSINNLKICEDSVITPLPENQDQIVDYKKIIKEIDKTLTDGTKVGLYAKISKTDSIVKVVNNDSWPDDTEVSYNIIKDNNGSIIYIAEYPVSESGDWSIGYRYYFNDKGNTIVFLRESNFFNSGCTDSVAKELSGYYFDTSFRIIAKEYELKSTDGTNLLNKLCEFPYYYKYTIESNLNNLKNRLKIKI